ncbi:MAG: FG-GAP-like repeat-containing protein [Saprospiraceae bacterium]|nr:FG-GAP-like repeat-containing protein [Saprospiraceae bacterium]
MDLLKKTLIVSAIALSPFILYSQVVFQEVSSLNGLDFDFVESLKMGGGAASFDFDNDGDEDIYVVGGMSSDGLFQNDGAGNFTNISAITKIQEVTSNIMTTSVVTGDINNDGYREIFVGTIGTSNSLFDNLQPNLLLQYNPATGLYSNIAQSALLEDASFCMGAHFFDSNQDGYLDLYISNYVKEPSLIVEGSTVVGFDHICHPNKLFINTGNGTFIDRSSFFNLEQIGCTLAATSSDLDGDNDPDLIVANDFGKWITPNQLFQNEGASAPFNNISESSNTNAKMYGMGIGVGDFDEDLDMDFYVTNIGENFFFMNEGDMLFSNIAPDLGIQNSTTPNGYNTTGWGAILEDFNNDSYIDIFVSNGYVYSAVDIDDEEQMDELYLGSSDLTFDPIGAASGITNLAPSRGALYGDWNKDGLLDIITIINEDLFGTGQNSIAYYENQSQQFNWVGFKLKGITSNFDAYGAKAYLHAADRTFLRELRGGDSHASQNSSLLHFGLHTIDQIDSLVVIWPSGMQNTYTELEINQYHSLTEKTPTSTFENQSLNEVTIFPNPADQYLTVQSSTYNTSRLDLLLINSTGKLVLKTHIKNPYKKIDISHLTSGIYTLVCTSASHTSTHKISIITP